MVKAYFIACEQAFPAQRAGPEGLLELRSIGTKSLPLIEAVCARYETNRTPSQGGTPLRQTGSCLTQECPPDERNGGPI